MPLEFHRAIPILRIFDLEKAKEFYLGFLDFTLDWEHRFEPGTPVYLQVSRGSVTFHLSEHHGDGCPGSIVLVEMTGIEQMHRELNDKHYKFMRPGLEREPWLSMTVIDPFNNRIRFHERK